MYLLVLGTAWIGPSSLCFAFGSVPCALLSLTAVVWDVKLSHIIPTILLDFIELDTAEYKMG